MADTGGSAGTYFTIILIVLILGGLYMMLTPLMDELVLIMYSNPGTVPETIQTINDYRLYFFPFAVIVSLVLWGWRKSSQSRLM
jgi:hypothetical protein